VLPVSAIVIIADKSAAGIYGEVFRNAGHSNAENRRSPSFPKALWEGHTSTRHFRLSPRPMAVDREEWFP
jgi:hypothetical protein